MVRSRLADQVGRVVGGRYRLLAPVGTGASADVYVADDVSLRRRVAVKILHDALAADEGFLRRFRAEARAVASLRHPNIMAVFDWGEEEDGPFLVLEYLGGGSLRDLLDRGSRLSPSQALLVGLEAARGLDYAHRRGLVHRDIKPANLLFDDEGRLAIADFGIARALAEATWTEPAGAVVGTVRYASPEQARGNSIDGRADVYALALVLVEAVTGQVPFAADTTIATLMARLDRPIPLIDELGPLAPVVQAAGAVDPSQRLDAAGLIKALDEAATQLPRPQPLPLVPSTQLPIPEVEAADRTTAFRAVDNGSTWAGAATAAISTSAPAAVDAPPTVVAPVPAPDSVAGSVPAPPGSAVPASVPVVAPPAAGVAPAGAAPAGLAPAGLAPAGLAPAGLAPAGLAPAEVAVRPRRRRLPWLAVTLLLVAAVVAGVILLPPLLRPTYAVPDLVGQKVEGLSAGPHFRVTVHDERVTGAKTGVVIGQHPSAGTHRASGAIAVDVSIGNALVAVPSLAGLPLAEADSLLRAHGLTPGTPLASYSSTVPNGTIINWNPKTTWPVDTPSKPIDIVVSEGSEFVTMPDVVTGQPTYATALATLQGAGITDVNQTQTYSNTVPEGDVISTTPAAGAQADRAKAVTVDVSKGPQTVAVPNVGGDSIGTAEKILEQAGLQVAVYGLPGASQVIDQRPSPGTQVPLGTTVQLAVF